MTRLIERYINYRYLTSNFVISILYPLISILMLSFAVYYVLIVAPTEAVMGPVQKIFYFHVSSAISCYLMISIMLISSILYLISKSIKFDLLAESAAKVGLMFASMVLCSGMIWAHSAWNTWWRWEPRLVSFLILWLILFGYLIYRKFLKGLNLNSLSESSRKFSAILAIISAIQVPVVVFSIKLLDHSQQLHPEVVANNGLKDPRFTYGLVFALVSLCAFSLVLFLISLVNRLQEEELDELYALGYKTNN